MEMVFGYIAAVLVGVVLGLLGAGGAILTVPIMVYLFHVDPVLATVYSLFIVGTTTLFGAGSYLKNKLIDIKSALYFAIPSVISMFITRTILLPAIPEVLLGNGSFTLYKGEAILSFFAIIMITSSYSMIKGGVKEKGDEEFVKPNAKQLVLLGIYGLVVGVVTGFVGAGGGFLIVPALVILAKMPIRQAVGTSLIIIAANSLAGFAGDLTGNYEIDWILLLSFLFLSIGGIFLGSYFTKFVSPSRLKLIFGWFVLIMGVYIITKELILK